MDNFRKIIPYDLQISLKHTLSEARIKKLEHEIVELKAVNEKYVSRLLHLEERLRRLEENSLRLSGDTDEFEEVSLTF
jgi:chromosome segregation ATPase